MGGGDASAFPRTRARLEAERTAVLAALATLVAAHAAHPGQFHVNQAGQTGGVSFGAGNTFHGAVQVGDLISGDTVIHGGITSGGNALVQEPLFYASRLDANLPVAVRPAQAAPSTLGAWRESLAEQLVAIELYLEAAGAATQ